MTDRMSQEVAPLTARDQACAVCLHRRAVFDLVLGVFRPCSACSKQGWRLAHRAPRRKWWRRR